MIPFYILKVNENYEIREKNAIQWCCFVCPVCDVKNWIYYGFTEDLSHLDPDGFVCRGCHSNIVFSYAYDLNKIICLDTSKKVKNQKQWIFDHCFLVDTKKECPISEEENEYDPLEIERLIQKMRDDISQLPPPKGRGLCREAQREDACNDIR
jgi:hypothetical protein